MGKPPYATEQINTRNRHQLKLSEKNVKAQEPEG